jgi:hypothetical protein
MKPATVERLLYFTKDGNDVLHPEEFRKRYGFEPDGVNFYYGLNAAGVAHLKQHGTAMRENHRTFFRMAVDVAARRRHKRFLVNLGLWPFEPPDPYGFVAGHPELVQRVAEELRGYQDDAQRRGGRLDLVVRYASEMNDPATPGQPWGRPPVRWEPALAEPYKRTLAHVRAIFARHAPAVRFTFSPALRADHTGERYDMIREFWPGERLVDLVSCTWYIGRSEHLRGAVENLERYLAWAKPFGKSFALDEIGGIDGETGSDWMLEQMFKALQERSVQAEYATLFLMSKWGRDATLAFLR